MKIYMVNRETLSECDGRQQFSSELLGLYTNLKAAQTHLIELYRRLGGDRATGNVKVQNGSFGRSGYELYYEDEDSLMNVCSWIFIEEHEALDKYEGP